MNVTYTIIEEPNIISAPTVRPAWEKGLICWEKPVICKCNDFACIHRYTEYDSLYFQEPENDIGSERPPVPKKD